MSDVYKSNEECNPGKRRKVLIMFGDVIADVTSNKKLHPVVTELSIMGRKLPCTKICKTKHYKRLIHEYSK